MLRETKRNWKENRRRPKNKSKGKQRKQRAKINGRIGKAERYSRQRSLIAITLKYKAHCPKLFHPMRRAIEADSRPLNCKVVSGDTCAVTCWMHTDDGDCVTGEVTAD